MNRFVALSALVPMYTYRYITTSSHTATHIQLAHQASALSSADRTSHESVEEVKPSSSRRWLGEQERATVLSISVINEGKQAAIGAEVWFGPVFDL